MNLYDTVIFDLDGTLLDTLEDLADSTNFALARHGMAPRSLDEIRMFVGNGVARLMERAVPKGTPQTLEAKCLEDFRAHYLTHMRRKTVPYPGVPELLEALRERGIRAAVVSNKFDGAVKELCAAYFGDLLPAALGERPGLRKKPAPDLVLACLKELGADPDRSVYVGDSEVDLETARGAGLPCISVTWGFREAAFLRERGARTLVKTPEELLTLLGRDGTKGAAAK